MASPLRSGRGLLITLEGIEGCGKSTQARLLANRLRAEKRTVTLTSEPGGTSLGRAVRAALLTPGRRVVPLAEWLLFEADRAQHVSEVVVPALTRGNVVVSDRFSDSSRAYQGFARAIGLEEVDRVDAVATGGLKPDLTIVLDLPVREGLARRRRSGGLNRIDREREKFHQKIRDAFLVLAMREPDRIKVVDGRIGRAEVAEVIWRHVSAVAGVPGR